MKFFKSENFRYSLWLVFFLLTPILLYFLIKEDIIIGHDEDGEPVQLGYYSVVGLFWTVAYFIHKYFSESKEAKQNIEWLKNQNSQLKKDLEKFGIQGGIPDSLEDSGDENIYEKYIDKNNLPLSLKNIDSYLKNKTGNTLELLDVKAEVLNLMGQENKAVDIYNKILSIDENYINAYIDLSTVYQVKGIKEQKSYSERIVNLLRKAEKIDSSKISFYVFASALKDVGNLEEALKYYDKAISQEKDDNYFLENIYSDIAKIFTEQKRYQEAIEAYDNAIKQSIKKYGDDSRCSETYAFKREIYELIGNAENIKEMDRKFSEAERLYIEKSESIHEEYHDEKLANINKSLEKLGEQEKTLTDDLYKIILLAIEDRYLGKMPALEKFEGVVDEVLDEVEYDKDIRAIEKAHLIKRFNEQNKNAE